MPPSGTAVAMLTTVLASLRSDWQRLKHGTPGSRFVRVHEARRAHARSLWTRGLWLVTGVALVVLGVVAGVVPGPGGIVFVVLGLALLARELRFMAIALDWLEPRLRAAWRKARGLWKRSLATRIAVVVLGVGLLGSVVLLGVEQFT